MPAEADWFKRDPDAPDEYAHGTTWSAWKAWQEAVRKEREACADLCERLVRDDSDAGECADAIRSRSQE